MKQTLDEDYRTKLNRYRDLVFKEAMLKEQLISLQLQIARERDQLNRLDDKIKNRYNEKEKKFNMFLSEKVSLSSIFE